MPVADAIATVGFDLADVIVTPPVGEIVEVNIFLRPGRSHVGNW